MSRAGGSEPAGPLDTYRMGVLLLALGTAPLLGYFGPLAYALVAALCGLLLAPVSLRARPPAPECWALAGVAAWAGLSLLWSRITPSLQLTELGDLEDWTAIKLPFQLILYACLVVGATRLSLEATKRVLWVFGVGALVWGVLLIGDGISHGRLWATLAGIGGAPPAPNAVLRKASQGAYVLAVLAWPAAAYLYGRGWRFAPAVMLGGLAIGSAAMGAFAATVALGAGVLAWLATRILRGAGVRGLGVLAAALLVLAPVVVIELADSGVIANVSRALTASWVARLEIWTFAAQQIIANPFGGYGLDASRTFGTAIPLHTHDAPLQLWLELGVPGVIFAAGFWLLLARRIAGLSTRAPDGAAVGAASAAAYFTIGALSFGVWQEWWLAVGALSWAACALYGKISAEDEAQLDASGLRNT